MQCCWLIGKVGAMLLSNRHVWVWKSFQYCWCVIGITKVPTYIPTLRIQDFYECIWCIIECLHIIRNSFFSASFQTICRLNLLAFIVYKKLLFIHSWFMFCNSFQKNPLKLYFVCFLNLIHYIFLQIHNCFGNFQK